MSKSNAHDEKRNEQFWEKVAQHEFENMDKEAQAQWSELRPRR